MDLLPLDPFRLKDHLAAQDRLQDSGDDPSSSYISSSSVEQDYNAENFFSDADSSSGSSVD